ncbi:hypothetical protein LMH87_006754 [Akanthomyces muscarius]|uniref:Uncharacterized protein n=1 Tax=Akanthomyces muscarius TaxID=2231603 RepID=A0A9W8QRS0_AKAMU|nr:hypothetical protein LMH87_006754 [Akanthomyces muscarius]KAJ4165107.1 hypothetical protein LMH87_006754 [Akanthomyces muscarius]
MGSVIIIWKSRILLYKGNYFTVTMVVGILVAVCAGIAICHTHHKRQRINAFKREYVAHNGPLSKEEWKQLCHEHKQARKAEKHARKAERHTRRADRRGCCWRTSLPAALPAPPAPALAPAPEMDVKYAYDNGDGDMAEKYFQAPSQRVIQIPVQGPDEPPAYMMPGSMTALPEKM